MWKLLKISKQTYFIYCNFKSTQDVTFILYDQETTWSQTLTLQDVKEKVKLLNKRFDFCEDNIKEALSSDVIQSAVIEEQPNTSTMNLESCLLKIKYRVKNCLLNYEWTLRKQNLVEFQQTFVQPLLLALLGCHQQVEILTDSIRKKDIELKQFRIEGVELNRKTLITKPFDFENFTKKYEDCNKIAIHFAELAKYVKEYNSKNNPDIINNHLNVITRKTEQCIQPPENLNTKQSANTKMSPRHKKRKVSEFKMQYLEEHLKIRKKGLEYESSQSQTIEVTEIKDLNQQIQSTTKPHETTKIENIPSPRKSSRCASIKQKLGNMSSEDKTESDIEDNLRKLKKRKTIKSLLHVPKDSSTISKQQAKTTVKNNAEATMRKCAKSSHLSNVTKTKSPEKSSEISNVFDFSTESEDDITLLESKNKSSKLPLLKGKKFLTNECLMLSFNNDCRSMVSTSPVLDCIPADSIISMRSQSLSKNLSQSPTPVVIDEISSQLDNIRKELESLEAMRLADLKQRTCKV